MISTKVGRLLLPRADAPREQNGYVDVLPFVQHFDYSDAGVAAAGGQPAPASACAHRRRVRARLRCRDARRALPRSLLEQVVTQALPTLRARKTKGSYATSASASTTSTSASTSLRCIDIDCPAPCGPLQPHRPVSALASLLPRCEARGVRSSLGGVFNSGILATGVRDRARPVAFQLRARRPPEIDEGARDRGRVRALRRSAARGRAAVSARASRDGHRGIGRSAPCAMERRGAHGGASDTSIILGHLVQKQLLPAAAPLPE